VRLFRTLCLAGALIAAIPARANESVKWTSWDADVFAHATADKKFVVLDLQATWCHWCHVMESVTYTDPGVLDLMAKHYVAVRVDQDANPDLASRYGYWGWPATIIFGPDGAEIAKIRGFVAPIVCAKRCKP
jgi:uncharacterized protein YyaL (SSP411 family)